MLKPGIYIWKSSAPGIWGGHIKLSVRETKASFFFYLLENTCKFNAPQMVSLFRDTNRLTIRKRGSKHAINFMDGNNEWFCLYPYRIGVPYAFRFIESIASRQTKDLQPNQTAEHQQNVQTKEKKKVTRRKTVRYIFKNTAHLRDWLQEKNFNAGSPEAFSEWLTTFLEEGNELMVDGCTDPYDYLDCMELV